MGEIFSPVQILLDANPLVQAVFVLLLAASIATWALIFERWMQLGTLAARSALFEAEFWSGRDLVPLYEELNAEPQSGSPALFVQAMREYLRLQALQAPPEEILPGLHRALRIGLAREERELARRLPILAIIASTAPYVGLLGTVWGVIDSFQGIGNAGQVTLASMAPGIAEALVATALGLFAAIPAAVAHNALGALAGRQGGGMEDFAEDMLAVIEQEVHAAGRQPEH